ncbi:uncharacterized protein LOC117600468 [Osmia lignaria lignaria]|uniref:uncharacterized protein LOC117600468 n=1 Tax=Osmia lignaria lignaria TaxID=1437193 RepID=UPI00402BC187
MIASKVLSIFLVLLAIQAICDAADSSEYADTYYNRKTHVVSTQVTKPNDVGISKLISFQGANCQCANLACSCCTGVRVKKLKFDKEICATINYLKQDIGVGSSLKVDQKQIWATSVSVRNPPAVCVPIPDFPAVKLCLRFHDLYTTGNGLHACVDLETHVKALPVLKLHFACAQL